MWKCIYDPRQPDHQKMPSYHDSVRNKVINYQHDNTNARTFGINGIFGPAWVTSLVKDHDCLIQPLYHQWIYNQIEAFANDAVGIESRTRSQSRISQWHYVRSTASRVGDMCTDKRNKEAFATALVSPTPFSTPAVLWGRQHEANARKVYEKNSFTKAIPCGLFISKDYHFIGASPDGFKCIATVLEIKCPYSIRKEKKSWKNLKYLEFRNGELKLKPNSNYHYQVQTQLLVTGREYCDFVVWTTKDWKRISVERNEDVIKQEILPQISAFYRVFMVPVIVKHFFAG